MKNTQQIFNAEFKNLYGLEKQISEVLPVVLDTADNNKLVKLLDKTLKHSNFMFDKMKQLLREEETNPGNVFDSVAQEMLNNLQEISNSDYSSKVKDIGVWASLNRLTSYRGACYRNAAYLAGQLDMKEIHKILKKSGKKNKKLKNKFKKIYKKLIK